MQKIDRFTGEYEFCSNFKDCTIMGGIVDDMGITYPTTEHAFQAAKSLDKTERMRISQEATPGKAKRAGGRNGYITLRPDWENVKDGVMLDVLRKKFAAEPFRSLLLNTGNAVLIEGNNHGDDYWGMATIHGKNMLGILLMQVRGELNTKED